MMVAGPLEPVVYFIEDPDTGLIKVGFTANIRERLASLRKLHKNLGLQLLATTPGNYRLENMIHLALDGTRHHGEWFNPSERLTSLLNLARVLTPQQVAEQGMVALTEPEAPPLSLTAYLDAAAERDAYWEERLDTAPPVTIDGWTPDALAYWGEWVGLL